MYIVRYNGKIRRGKMSEAIAFFKKRLADNPGKMRACVNVFGDNDILALEVEFDTIEAAARHVEWTDTEAQAEITAQGWYEISAGNVVELWRTVT